MARNRLDLLGGHLPAAITRVAGVKVLVAIRHHIGNRHHAATALFAFGLGRSRNVEPLRNFFADAPHRFPDVTHGIAVGRNESDIGEEYIARKVAPLNEQTWRDPALAVGPPRD